MILTGEILQIALSRTHNPIELRDKMGARVASLTAADQVTCYLERGYEAHGQKRRVRSLQPPMPKPFVAPLIPWQDCWLTRAAAVIRFHGECV